MTPHYSSDILSDYVHGAVSAALDRAIFVHLESCDACRSVRDEEASLGEVLRAAALLDERELPSMVRARVWDAVRRERPTLLGRLRSRWATALAVPVAACLALAAYIGTPMIAGTSAPRVTASYYLDEHNAQTTESPLGPSVAPAVYSSDGSSSADAASYIDNADAATLDDADGAGR
jgi:predicted anti-sigma-YlaC factor YlaD